MHTDALLCGGMRDCSRWIMPFLLMMSGGNNLLHLSSFSTPNKKCVTMWQMPLKTKTFLDLRSEVKVTVIQKQCVTLRNPKMYSHTKFGFPTSNNIGEMDHRHDFSRTEARGQGHSEPSTVCDNLRSRVVSTYQKWDSYIKIFMEICSKH